MTIAKQRFMDICAMRNIPSKEPRALHTYNNTQVAYCLMITHAIRPMKEEQFYVMERLVLDRLIFPCSCSLSSVIYIKKNIVTAQSGRWEPNPTTSIIRITMSRTLCFGKVIEKLTIKNFFRQSLSGSEFHELRIGGSIYLTCPLSRKYSLTTSFYVGHSEQLIAPSSIAEKPSSHLLHAVAPYSSL
jgi:hypothetical protein